MEVRWDVHVPEDCLALGALNFLSKNRSDLELAQSQKKYHFQKVSKTKDLDILKNFFS
jgi:hypothetical protein